MVIEELLFTEASRLCINITTKRAFFRQCLFASLAVKRGQGAFWRPQPSAGRRAARESDWSIQTRSLARYGWGLAGAFIGLSLGIFLLLMLAAFAQRTHG
jgi:hypothetical protein